MMFMLSMLFSFMKNLKSSRNALPIICSVCGLLPDVGASTNKSIGWREGDIVHRNTCINSLCKSLIIFTFNTPSTNYKRKEKLKVLFAVQALFNGLAWAPWVCTHLMNVLFNSILKEKFLTQKHLRRIFSLFDFSLGYFEFHSFYFSFWSYKINHVLIKSL